MGTIRGEQARSQATVQELLDAIQGKVPAKPLPPIDHARDVELPNESGVIDPRLQPKLSLSDLASKIDALMGVATPPATPVRRKLP